jgi:hypothetical protein
MSLRERTVMGRRWLMSRRNSRFNEEKDYLTFFFHRPVQLPFEGWVDVRVPSRVVHMLKGDTDLRRTLGAALLSKGVVNWPDPEPPILSSVEEPSTVEDIYECWIDRKGQWRIGRKPLNYWDYLAREAGFIEDDEYEDDED